MARVRPFHRPGQSRPLLEAYTSGRRGRGLSAQGSPQTEIPGHCKDPPLLLMDMTPVSESPAHVETRMCLPRVPPVGSS